MSEIRDKAKREIANYLTDQFLGQPSDYPPDECFKEANHILSIPELAVVDREAELEWETETACVGDCNISCHSIERNITQRRMLKDGYVKEIKE